jgi:ABC-type lipoprotein export system ATPase subunit
MGSKLSGGQIQRFGIIRALMRDPKIIILDESTNSLDNKTEDEILAIFKKEKFKNKIIIFITHNKKLLRFCNRVITLKNQKVHLNLKKDEVRNF